MVRTALAMMLTLAVATGAAAYDRLYTGDSAAIPEAPSFGIEGSFLYVTIDGQFNEDGESEDWEEGNDFTGRWIPVRITYVPMNGLEIGASPIFMMETLNNDFLDKEFTGTGIGDTWAWAKYSFSLEPVLSARLGVKLPTGNDEVLPNEDELVLGSGQTDIDASLMVGLPAGEGVLDLAFGYRVRLARTVDEDGSRAIDEIGVDEKPGDEIHFLLGFSHSVGDDLSLRVAADGFFGAEPTIDGELIPVGQGETRPASSAVHINPGVDYRFSNGVTLGVDVHYPLMGSAVYKETAFGVSLGFSS